MIAQNTYFWEETTTEPVPLKDVPTQKPTTTSTPKAPETQPSKLGRLAKTGTNAGILAVLVPLVAAFGAIFYFTSRKEND